MRRLACLLALIVASLLAVLPGGAAQAVTPKAAKPNAWLGYFPAKGVTCTSTMTDPADGSTLSDSVTVVAKSSKRIVLHERGSGRITAVLLPRGRMRQEMAQKLSIFGIRERISVAEGYPSPAAALAHGAATGQLTMVMTVPPREAKAMLTTGQSMTVTANIRAVGAGARTISLADPAATTVNAVGVRTELKHFRVSRNAKPGFARYVKRAMGSVFATMASTEWFAPGRGPVLEEFTFAGTALTATQTGCS